MNYQSLKQLCAAATVLSALAAPSQATASAPQMCGATTTTGNALTLGQNECVSGNGLYFYLDVENDGTTLEITTTGGTGEVDILTSSHSWATGDNYDTQTNNAGTTESVQLTADTGKLYITLYGLHQEVTFNVAEVSDENPAMCGAHTPSGYALSFDNQECISGNGLYYYVDVPTDNTDVTITTSGGSGDADIFVNTGNWASRANHIAASENEGSDNSLTINTNIGRLYLSIFGIHQEVSLMLTQATGDSGPGDGSDPATDDYIVIDKNVVVNIPTPILSSRSEFSDVVNTIIAGTWDDWAAIASGTPDPISDVADAIHFLAAQDDINNSELDQLVYFLRNYSFNGHFENFSQDKAQRLSNALHAVAKMTDFQSTDAPAGLIQEGYATAMLNLSNSPASDYFSEHLPHLLALTQYYSELSNPYDFANFGYSTEQLLSAIYDLAFYAKNDSALNAAYADNMLATISVLRSYGLAETGLDMRWSADTDRKWILAHLFIALGNISNIADEATKARIDSIIIEIFEQVTNHISIATAKAEVTATYLETTGRTCDTNDALANYCTPKATVDDILSITHQCNDKITIRAQAMTSTQLTHACNQMAETQGKFHEFFATNNIPVNDDTNVQLEVIAYATPEDYEKYGYDFFGHNTDNGGIYLEGNPSEAGNIARFHAMQCPESWVGYSCVQGGDVYNLQHEFVHYLDGRFNLYGAFEYHDNTVSWAEGWAEYIAKGAGNTRNLDSVVGESIPPLHNILFMDYGFNDLYPWSYLAMQYLAEERPNDVATLAQALRNSDISVYQAALAQVSATDGDGFLNWAQANSEAIAPSPQIIPPAHTFGSCELVYQYARDAQTPASVTITNTTNTPVTLYWINNSSGEINFDNPYQTLNQGESYSADYWSKDDRLAVTDQLKNCLGVAVMTEADNNYTIDEAMVVDAITEEVLPQANTLGSCDLLNAYDRTADAASISVTNTTDNPINLYWVNNTSGEPNLSNNYQTLNNGDTYTADYWSQGDRMMISDSSNNCLGVAVLSQAQNTYIIDASHFETNPDDGSGGEHDTYVGLTDQALVDELTRNTTETVNALFQLSGTDAGSTFSEANILTVVSAIEERAATYSGVDTDNIENLIYFLRAAYYVQFYTEDVPAYSSDVNEMIMASLTVLFDNDNTWIATAENGKVLSAALVLVDSANLGAEFNYVTIRVLYEYNAQWQAHRDMNIAANSVFTTLFRSQWDDNMKALFSQDDSILDALQHFQSSHRDLLGTDAEYVLVNSVRELSRLYHVDALNARVQTLVKGILDTTSKADESRVLWLAAASMADYYDRANCGYYDICGFAYTLEKETLGFNYKCSDTLKIRAQSLFNDQGAWICEVLGTQEANFHQTLATLNIPVADDNNDALELVIFDSSNDYKTYAGQFFNINTDNGGMYLEGAPSAQNNQARFIAYEAEWKRPNFHVWNLQHEFVHYLDARFNLYGDFATGMAVSTVWWTEGLAEYISQRDGNTYAISMGESQEFALSEIFKNTYESGQDRVYRWGYLAVRFMFENHRGDVDQLLTYLRNNQYTEYQTYMDSIGTSYDAEWFDWLVSGLSTDDSGIVEFGPADDEAQNSGTTGNWAGDPVTISTDFSPCVIEVPANGHDPENNVITFNSTVECVNSSANRASFVIANSDGLSSNLTITSTGGWGNADILYKADGWATAQDNDASAANNGNEESLTVTLDADIYWHYITLAGEFGGVELTLSTQ
ncbi:hypothetical protein NBRC116592_09670 [Colwellia sp. KU-HH00111]|uniref:collagenase n=1 Tax=Colwellia sp. KU-HH00111 TaxID=3127652 RepID=UPI00310A5496